MLRLEDAVLQPQLDVRLTGGVHAVVEAPDEPVRVFLRISAAAPELIRDELLGVRREIAIRVAHQPEVGRLRHEDAAVEDLQIERPRTRPSAKTVRVSIRPSPLRILEDDHAADRLVLVGPGGGRP